MKNPWPFPEPDEFGDWFDCPLFKVFPFAVRVSIVEFGKFAKSVMRVESPTLNLLDCVGSSRFKVTLLPTIAETFPVIAGPLNPLFPP